MEDGDDAAGPQPLTPLGEGGKRPTRRRSGAGRELRGSLRIHLDRGVEGGHCVSEFCKGGVVQCVMVRLTERLA